MSIFNKPTYSTITYKKKDIPKGLWTKDPVNGEILYHKDLENNMMVAEKSGYHFPIGARERITTLLDIDTFVEYDKELKSGDPLQFSANGAAYKDKVEQNQAKTKESDAVISGIGKMGDIPVSIAVMNFKFLGGSLGSVVGEKITRAIERGANERKPVIVISASGGARMHEGILSLMQMAKTGAALAKLNELGLPYISVLTNPTTGGVSASYATLGDVILAEPGAMIGFAGARVIKETIQQDLPEGFQTSEFLFDAGLIDQIVPRTEMRERIIFFLKAYYAKVNKQTA